MPFGIAPATEVLQKRMIEVIQKCMQRGRQSLFLSGMPNEMKDLVSNCKTCSKYQSAQAREPLVPFEVPELLGRELLQIYFSLERIIIF